MWNLSFPSRDGTCAPCSGVNCLNYWASREVFIKYIFKIYYVYIVFF